MQLSSQTITLLCMGDKPMIKPAKLTREVINGKSAGVSAASYDMTIGHNLTLGIHPGLIIANHVTAGNNFDKGVGGDLYRLQYALWDNPSHTALAFTAEDLDLPNFIGAQVADKSSYARVFVSALNTFADPGFTGNLTLELINHGPEPVTIKAGDPIVQLLFTTLDQSTTNPYVGKYQHQTKEAHGARYEAPTSDVTSYGDGTDKPQYDYQAIKLKES